MAEANREAALWSLRSDVRQVFFRMLASQERVRLLSDGVREVEQLIAILRRRENEGEGSRYDRLRAERELSEIRVEVTAARSLVAAASARLAGYLPEGTQVRQVRGELSVPAQAPEIEELIRRAVISRAGYRAEQKTLCDIGSKSRRRDACAFQNRRSLPDSNARTPSREPDQIRFRTWYRADSPSE